MCSLSSERRKFVRVGESLLLSYRTLSAQEAHQESFSNDISGGGVKMPFKEEPKVGDILELSIELLKEKKRMLLEAKVIWVKANPDDKSHPYQAGLEFTNIGLREKSMLSNYLQYLNRYALLREYFRF
ncbi:MAG: PilZ domain-containing protein [Candidatus Omnitrophica bacterium]|nr:PilZ domain-containing protein [Candidatus Omnitrophota bacterium]